MDTSRESGNYIPAQIVMGSEVIFRGHMSQPTVLSNFIDGGWTPATATDKKVTMSRWF
jgi:hypothetical protein